MTMTFDDWLEQVGLAHCRQPLLENGVDFDVVFDLTTDDFRRCGLNVGDTRRLLRALSGMPPSIPGTDAAGATALPVKRARDAASERRQLTVMFCDLIGYTALTQRYDGEVIKQMIADYRESCSAIVKRYGGYVAQRLADGLMVYFGWPTLHEDDAERCVRAALEILQAIAHVRFAEPLAVHIGIATGSVIVGAGSSDGNADDRLAVGETPNLASRLQEMAGPNEVVIAATTLRLVGDRFDVSDCGIRDLKGIVTPVQTWRVDGVRTNPWRFRAAHPGMDLTGLVGRRQEIDLLYSRWEWARGGGGQVVLLSGEPGIGKSRVTQELRERLKGEPHTALFYQCSSFRRNSALYPIVQQLEFAAGFARDDSPEQRLDKLDAILAGTAQERTEAAALFAPLMSLPTDRYPPLGLSPQRRKEMLLDALAGQVAALSRVKPVLIVFEDAQWIDPTSQELLDLLVPRLPSLCVLLLITHRPQYAAHGREYPHVFPMALTTLPAHLGSELVAEVAHGKMLPADVVDQIVAHADGVPLFIEELTKSVLESHVLHEEADRYTLLQPLRSLTIPTTLKGLLQERLGRREAVRELAQIGACIGRQFSHDLLSMVSPSKGRAFDEDVQRLIATGLVFCRGTGADASYTFKHALVQDAAYESLLNSKRQEWHARIAQALETEFRDRVDSEPEVLAHHQTQAGHLTAAIPLWRKAGEQALTRQALQEAVAYLEKGLALIDGLPASAERDRLELSLREPLHAARLRWHGWAAPDVGANAAEILRLAPGAGTADSLLIGLWGTWVWTITQGRVAEAPSWARRLLAEGERTGEIDLQILGRRGLISSHYYAGELQQAADQGERVLALYRGATRTQAARWMERTGNDVRTAVGVFASQCLWMLGYPDRARAMSDEKDADSRQLAHPFDIGWALTWGSYVFDYRREPDALLARVAEAERIGREQSIPIVADVLAPIGEGLAMLRLGRLTDAIGLLRRGITLWNASGGQLNVPYLKSALAEAHARHGDVGTALGLIEECLDQIERPGWHERVWLPEVLRLKGWMLMRQGNVADADVHLRESLAWARRQQAKSWELRTATTLAELLVARGAGAEARALLSPVYGWFDAHGDGLETRDLQDARVLLASLP